MLKSRIPILGLWMLLSFALEHPVEGQYRYRTPSADRRVSDSATQGKEVVELRPVAGKDGERRPSLPSIRGVPFLALAADAPDERRSFWRYLGGGALLGAAIGSGFVAYVMLNNPDDSPGGALFGVPLTGAAAGGLLGILGYALAEAT